MLQIASLTSCEPSWCTSPRLQKWALGFLGALAVFQGFWTVFCRDNDFLWHRNHAEHFLSGTADKGYHYLPVRGLMDVPLAIGPYYLTRAAVYCLALFLLMICHRRWNELAARSLPAADAVVRGAGILTVLLLLPYLIRDLDECGLQIILLFFLTMAGWTLSRGRTIQAGFWLGTAACYKVTPILFLPFLLWKRQWRAAGSMAVFTGMWCLAPSLYTGWEQNVRAHQEWYAGVQRQQAAHSAYPRLKGIEPARVNNMSLQAAFARYLETYPPGHPLCVDHVCFVQFGRLSPEAAYFTVNGILGVLGLWFAWKTRRPWCAGHHAERDDYTGAFAGEWAAVCALCALLSPLCWKQHMVLLLPCLYLVLRSVLSTTGPRGWRMTLIWVCAALMCLFPGPEIFGGNFSGVLHSYKLHTLGATMLMIWALFLPAGRAEMALRALPVGFGSLRRILSGTVFGRIS